MRERRWKKDREGVRKRERIGNGREKGESLCMVVCCPFLFASLLLFF